MPSFPGGEGDLNKYINKHLKYPEKVMQGKVIVRFIVEPDGHISNAKIMKSLNAACDQAALKVINNMPPWDPGMQNGTFVAVYYNLPITFALF